MMVLSQALLAGQVARLEKANKAAPKRKQRRRKQIQKGRDLLKAKADKLVTKKDVKA
jgi:hypothetical protein